MIPTVLTAKHLGAKLLTGALLIPLGFWLRAIDKKCAEFADLTGDDE